MRKICKMYLRDRTVLQQIVDANQIE